LIAIILNYVDLKKKIIFCTSSITNLSGLFQGQISLKNTEKPLTRTFPNISKRLLIVVVTRQGMFPFDFRQFD